MTTPVMTFYRTSTGKKIVMAVSGIIVLGFVFIHMLGNLQIFSGPEQINQYAEFLKSLGGILWVFRTVLLVAAIIHIVAATQTTLQSWSARPQRYAVFQPQKTTYAARTMRFGGPLLGIFIVYHLLHLTVGSVQPSGVEPFDPHHVYNNIVFGFQIWWLSALYIIAMIFLGLHIFHGAWSLFQSLGLAHPKWNIWRHVVAVPLAVAITVGNISIPVAVYTGLIGPA